VNPFDFPFALLAFFGFVLVVPPWMWFTTQHPAVSDLQIEAQFMVQLVLPALAALTIASWVQPGG
jgi:hypothetical protein